MALIEWADEVNCWVGKEVDTQAKLQRASELLQQKEQEFEAERQKLIAEKAGLEAEKASLEAEKAVLEAKHKAEVESLEDANYANFENGFNKVVAQIKFFNKEVLIDFSLVDWEKRLNEILEQQSPAEGGSSPGE